MKWSPFLDSGAQSPIFWYPKLGTFWKSACFQVPKNGTLYIYIFYTRIVSICSTTASSRFWRLCFLGGIIMNVKGICVTLSESHRINKNQSATSSNKQHQSTTIRINKYINQYKSAPTRINQNQFTKALLSLSDLWKHDFLWELYESRMT